MTLQHDDVEKYNDWPDEITQISHEAFNKRLMSAVVIAAEYRSMIEKNARPGSAMTSGKIFWLNPSRTEGVMLTEVFRGQWLYEHYYIGCMHKWRIPTPEELREKPLKGYETLKVCSVCKKRWVD